MAKTKTSFKPGQSGNPAGPKKLPAELQELKKNTTNAYLYALYKYVAMPPAQIQKYVEANAKTLSTLDMGIIHLCRSMANGDAAITFRLLERLFGKPEQPITGDMSISGGITIVAESNGRHKPR